MGEEERSPRELNQNSQDFEQKTSQNGFIKDSNGKLYLPKNYLSEQGRKPSWLLKPRKGGKTLWDWLDLLFVPALIAIIAGVFTLITVSQQNKISRQQNEIFKQRDEAEKDHNQQALLVKYLDDISELVEKKLLTLNDDENSETQKTIARARTLSVLRALDSDRKGELIQFLSAAKLIEKNKPIIGLNGGNLEDANLRGANLDSANLRGANLMLANLKLANLKGADLKGADLWGADLKGANLKGANLDSANLRGANLMLANLKLANLRGADLGGTYLWGANPRGADLWGANLKGADLKGANLKGANLMFARELNPAQVKTACNWEKARFSEEFKQKLDQEPDQKVDCSEWN